jgi:putative PIG3 family NAD(P)H quinone oxidoreductase
MTIPAKMRFIDITEPGGPEVLQIANGPVPQPGEREVLIRISAAGVNRPDVAQRLGMYPVPPGASPIPGLEVSGEVVLCGDGATRFVEGDQVCALANGGGYAEYVSVPEGQCLPIPGNLSLVEAAGLPETFFTVWTNVFDRGALASGETFLVHGGSSGIGTTAIQLAKARGATVFATAGSREKCTACEELGADIAVNYREQDFVEVLKDATDGRGVDVILDMVGGDYVARNADLAALHGRVVIIATLGGKTSDIELMPILMKCLVITGSVLRPRTDAEKAAIAASLLKHAWPLIESGRVKPVIHSVFSLEDVAKAHTLMESSAHIGKIVLKIQDSNQS